MADDSNEDNQAQLSRHYDSMLWIVSSIWATAIGGLLVYCNEHADVWLDIVGLILTPIAMFFAYDFRRLRRRIHKNMDKSVERLYVSGAPFTQWDALAIVFLSLTVLWTRQLIRDFAIYTPTWIILTVIVTALIGLMWGLERRKNINGPKEQ